MPPARPRRRRARLAGVAVASALLSGLGLTATPGAFAADGPCAGDDCDGGAWAAGRAGGNAGSYWGMFAGHNCTNYVAWRLTMAGVQQPPTNPGNASTWAERAAADGIVVNDEPSVGSVAQWDSYAGGNGVNGHVAFVEKVYDDGTILISEDYWHGGNQIGPLTYRVVPADSPSHYIHYISDADWLRTNSFSGDAWGTSPTGLDIAPTSMAALALTGAPLQLFYPELGTLHEATQAPGGWKLTDTGVVSNATSLSVLTMYGTKRPYVMSVDGGVLIMTVRADVGWQRMSTGFEITGDVSAVDLGGLWPTVFLSQGGALWRIWGDNEGWHSEPTDSEAWGPISAVVNADGWPVVFNAHNGFLWRIWQDEAGWHTESTGLEAEGAVSAVQTATGPEVYVTEDDQVYRITADGASWAKNPTGLDAGTILSAIPQGDAAPLLLQAG